MLKGKFKKLVSLLLALVIVFSCVGCADDETKKVDKTKTQLYVGIYDGGLDDDWLEAAITRFEAAYEGVEFTPGKPNGVQVFVDKDKSTMDGIPLLNLISSKRDEVYFTERVFYYDYLSQDALADITDAVTEPLTEYGETDSIESKMAQSYQDYFKVDGKYYGLPFHTANNGLVFDADLFELRKFYFKDGGGWTGKLSEATAGQDGVKGTYDDGLPITYNDFFKLCDRIQSLDCTPILWTGKYLQYPLYLLESLWADYEGYESMLLNYNYNGTANSLVKTTSGGMSSLNPTTININNGYELQKQAGKYHALSFAKELISHTSYWDSESFSPALSHTGAQERFLMSKYSSNIKDVAMLVEGTWWEMEATSIFNDMETTYGEKVSKQSRNFGTMPFPKVSEADVAKGNTLVAGSCVAFVSNYCASAKLDLAKKFIRFMHTDVSLSEFNSIVSIPRPFDYDISEDDWKNMTHYGKSVYEMHTSSNTKIIYNSSSNDTVRRNGSYFHSDNSFMSTIGGTTYDNPMVAFKDNANLTVNDYFNGLYTYKKATWSTIFN